MKNKILAPAAAAILAAFLMPLQLAAGMENQLTELTIRQTIEVPGATLEPGDYTIQIMDNRADDGVVAIRNADTQKLETIAMTVPVKQHDVPSETKFTFYEAAPGQAPALRSWFYPGSLVGHQFVYDDDRSKEIAKNARRHVPSMAKNDYDRMRNTSDPLKLNVHEFTVYSISPDAKKASIDDGNKWNRDADAMTWTPDEYLNAREVEESRMARQIRKEIVTLPFYSLWDNIEYRIDGSTVTLMGSVYRPSMVKSVERVVKRVEGVEKVKNEIEQLPVSPNDDRLRMALYRAIYGHPALNNYQLRAVPPIHIIVKNGNVTLEGAVLNAMDKNIAFIQANGVPGVFKVTNNLRTDS